jgi:hypothetical protein
MPTEERTKSMTARQKIEWITNNWYGFAVVSALVSVFTGGLDVIRTPFTIAGLAMSLGLTWMFGKLLLGKSSMTRFVLVVVSVLGVLFHGLAIAWHAWSFFGRWELALLFKAGFSILCVMMHGRSFAVLTDREVKGYIAQG